MRKKIRVVHKKLGKGRVWGWADFDNSTIEIDERATGKKHLEIAVHESIHILNPQMSEEDVTAQAITITDVLWKLKYRRVDDSNNIPLQDGKK